jgi:hypothetical protein
MTAQAYFVRTTHIDPGNYHRIYIITNDWHMPRTQAIFSHIFSLPLHTPHTNIRTQTHTYPTYYDLKFISAPPGIDDKELLALRKGREQESLRAFNAQTKKVLTSMQVMHQWLFTQHAAYATKRFTTATGGNNSSFNAALLKTY